MRIFRAISLLLLRCLAVGLAARLGNLPCASFVESAVVLATGNLMDPALMVKEA